MSTTSTTTPVKYINNKELLLEIHNSKKTFCVFLEPHHANFDTIVHDISEITPELIDAVREKKAKPRGKPALELEPPENIVVRVMTYEHIPLDPDRVRKSRVTDQSYARTSFPPFKHYILTSEGVKEVCRSHWKGGFENGHFEPDSGKINNRLAVMIMLLVERYSRRGNFRGYCLSDDHEALTQRGWLKYNEITTNDIVLSYENGKLTWSKIISIYRDHYEGNMFKLTGRGIDALVTPGHKFVTKNGGKTVEDLLETDTIILMGEAINSNEIYCNDYIEFVNSLNKFNFNIEVKDIQFLFETYKGIVWCLETEYGSFIVRRNGCTYLTHNSYIEEMRGQALLQLSQIGLQFDESKSDNPFAWYTTAIRNSFVRILNIEKKSQSIRDDLLIIAGAAPSYTRQTDNDLEYKFASEKKPKKSAGIPLPPSTEQ